AAPDGPLDGVAVEGTGPRTEGVAPIGLERGVGIPHVWKSRGPRGPRSHLVLGLVNDRLIHGRVHVRQFFGRRAHQSGLSSVNPRSIGPVRRSHYSLSSLGDSPTAPED